MRKMLWFALVLCSITIAHVLAQPPHAARTMPPKFEVLETQLPDAKVQTAFVNLLLALENSDYDRFVNELTLVFRANVDEVLFKQMHESISARMTPGYRAIYMGELNKPGFKTFVFKLVFKDRRGEVLTTLSFNADARGQIVEADKEKLKVAGFYLH